MNILNKLLNMFSGSNKTNDPEISQIIKSIKIVSQIKLKPDKIEFERVLKRTGLSETKLWWLSLDGILTQSGDADHYSLNFGTTEKKLLDHYREGLREAWDVYDKSSLLETLHWLETSGHSNSYRNCLNVWKNSDQTKKNIYIREHKKEGQSLLLVGHTAEYIHGRNLMAWDYGRAIMLCRRGYILDYFTEEEAWNNISRFASKLGDHYNSWVDYAVNYYIGRVFWAEDKLKISRDTFEYIEKLTSSTGAWTIVPFLGNNAINEC